MVSCQPYHVSYIHLGMMIFLYLRGPILVLEDVNIFLLCPQPTLCVMATGESVYIEGNPCRVYVHMNLDHSWNTIPQWCGRFFYEGKEGK